MANLTEDGSSYAAGIYQLERTDPVLGGVGGAANIQPTQLASRTAWLKNRVMAALRMEDINQISGIYNVSTADIGQVLCAHDPAGTVVNLPDLAAFPKGEPLCLVVSETGTGDTVALNVHGEDVIEQYLNNGDGVNSLTLLQGTRMVFIATEHSWVIILKTVPVVSVSGFTPGDVKFTAAPTSVPQPGFLLCAGQLISRTTYADLFATIGTIYGDGDETTTFQLPDYRDRFPRVYNGGQGFDAGRAFGTYQDDALKAHSHSVGLDIKLSDYETHSGGDDAEKAYIRGGGVSTGSTGDTETRPKNFSVNGWIKY